MYQFYLRDLDSNWWEFQYDTSTYAQMRAAGLAFNAAPISS
ncbi:hypothetical protein [Chondromyces apiculatus]|uniref:Uncharacterized protein n=1 Tax=Chondromyces apiculatus DSM 436 TaxID=1192034 RepID=A0A017TFX6_9BACT|nr:hypothetical protein [Chondromyces apiculatus]EYF08124.1 Hypothetical protein CAP_5884 [Chondromyces apiculatus DSM 436]